MANGKCVVLDFDGTIADSESILLDIYKRFAKKFGFPNMTHKDYVRLRSGTPQDAMRWSGVRVWQIPRLLRIGRREYEKHTRDIKIFPYMPEVIKKLASSDYDVYVLSSNSKETVKSILAKNELDDFAKILKSSPLFRKHKILKKLLKSEGYDKAESWMIGDELRDIEAAKKAKMQSIGVVWGLQSESALKNAEPTVLAQKPADILKILQKD